MPQSFLPRSFRGQLAMAGLLLVALSAVTPAGAQWAGTALIGFALTIWLGLLSELVWRRSEGRPLALRRLAAWPLVAITLFFAAVSLNFAGQSVGLLPAPTATPSSVASPR